MITNNSTAYVGVRYEPQQTTRLATNFDNTNLLFLGVISLRISTFTSIARICWGSYLTPTYQNYTMGYHYDFETLIMSSYRRLTIRGGTYFFTVVAYRRQPLFIDDARVELLRHAFRELKAKRPFDVVAVILPNHLHCLWNLPEGDADFSTRWQIIKISFSRRLAVKIRKDGSKTVWQPRFYEHCIRDERDFHNHLDYIYYNPVK